MRFILIVLCLVFVACGDEHTKAPSNTEQSNIRAIQVDDATKARLESQLESAQRAIEEYPTSDNAWSQYTSALRDLGRYDDYLAAVNNHLEVTTDPRTKAYLLLVKSLDHEKKQDYVAALADIEASQVAAPSVRMLAKISLDIKIPKVRVLRKLGKYHDAMDELTGLVVAIDGEIKNIKEAQQRTNNEREKATADNIIDSLSRDKDRWERELARLNKIVADPSLQFTLPSHYKDPENIIPYESHPWPPVEN